MRYLFGKLVERYPSFAWRLLAAEYNSHSYDAYRSSLLYVTRDRRRIRFHQVARNSCVCVKFHIVCLKLKLHSSSLTFARRIIGLATK